MIRQRKTKGPCTLIARWLRLTQPSGHRAESATFQRSSIRRRRPRRCNVSLIIALITLACMIVGTLLGVWIQKVLPEHHRGDSTKDVVKTAAGMMATLVALVVGLLVSSAKSSFDSTSARITEGGAKVITL